MKQPDNADAGRAPTGSRPPDYVLVLAQQRDLRDRFPDIPMSLAEALETPRSQNREPEADLEAEP